MRRASDDRGCCPPPLRGLRRRNSQNVKYCFNFNLNNPCRSSEQCEFAHGCMRCGAKNCRAISCWMLNYRSPEYDEDFVEDTWQTDAEFADDTWQNDDQPAPVTSPYRSRSPRRQHQQESSSRRQPQQESSSSSSKSLETQVAVLQKQVHTLHDDLQCLSRTVYWFEKTLRRHGFDLDAIQSESGSELD